MLFCELCGLFLQYLRCRGSLKQQGLSIRQLELRTGGSQADEAFNAALKIIQKDALPCIEMIARSPEEADIMVADLLNWMVGMICLDLARTL